jgi:hypothetical protein
LETPIVYMVLGLLPTKDRMRTNGRPKISYLVLLGKIF